MADSCPHIAPNYRFRNVATYLRIYAVQHSRRTKTSFTLWWKPEIAHRLYTILHFSLPKYHIVYSNIYISNKMQRYTVYFIWKLLYMFRVVPPPIIRSAYNCIYSIWYLSHRYCYLEDFQLFHDSGR